MIVLKLCMMKAVPAVDKDKSYADRNFQFYKELGTNPVYLKVIN